MQKSDPFGGARPIDEKQAAERRQKLLLEKVCARYVKFLPLIFVSGAA